MTKTENAVIKYQLDFEKFKNGQANAIVELLDNASSEIAKHIKKTTGVYTKERYKEIAKKLKEISASLKKNVESGIDVDGVIDYELKKQSKILDTLKNDIMKVKNVGEVNFLYPSAEQIKTAALFKPITSDGYGMTWESFLNGIENGFYNTWDIGVRTGYLTGQTTQQIVKSVIGGVSKIDKLANPGSITSLRNSVYANTRTALQALANETQRRVYEENEKYFGGGSVYKYEYLACLDSRTCLVCGADDGRLYKTLKEALTLPRHRGDRCMIIPYYDIEGDTRASKDGQVDAKLTFNDWLKEQDEATQKEVLGTTRYKLFKEGNEITQFVDNGKTLTLAQLVERNILNASGGILDKSEEEQELFAKDYYREIRNRKSKSDIEKIAKNTGFPSEKISAVRKHIFEDSNHLFVDGSKGKFNESAYTALAWQRLEQNRATENDILLLNHEYVELSFMTKKGYNYEKAHWLANLRYPWEFKAYKRWSKLNDVEIHEIIRKCLKGYL